jgi:hypothetical protein
MFNGKISINVPLQHSRNIFLEGTCIDLNALHRFVHKQNERKGKLQRSSKLVFIFLEAFSDPFVAAVETASQSSLGTRAKLHKVVAAEESLLLGETVEYAAAQAHRPTPVPMTHPSFPSPATRVMLIFPPKIIFLEVNKVNNIIT